MESRRQTQVDNPTKRLACSFIRLILLIFMAQGADAQTIVPPTIDRYVNSLVHKLDCQGPPVQVEVRPTGGGVVGDCFGRGRWGGRLRLVPLVVPGRVGRGRISHRLAQFRRRIDRRYAESRWREGHHVRHRSDQAALDPPEHVFARPGRRWVGSHRGGQASTDQRPAPAPPGRGR